MSNIEKLKRHLSKPIPITIKNSDGAEDVFYFKPLNIEQQAIMMELSKNFQGREKVDVDGKQVPDITKEDMKEMELLLIDIVKNSLEDVDEQTVKDFVNSNFNQLSEKLEHLIPDRNDSKALKLIKAKQEGMNLGK